MLGPPPVKAGCAVGGLGRCQGALPVVQPLAADIALFEQGLVARDIAADAFKICRGLLLAGIQAGRIDAGYDLAGANAVAGLDGHAGQDAGDAE